MYCARCKKWNEDQMLFCGYCGAPLATEDDGPAPSAPADRDSPYAPPRSEPREPVPMQAHGAPELSRPAPVIAAGSRAERTLIPRREVSVDEDDLFMDGAGPAEQDPFDDDFDEERSARRAEKKRRQSFEEAEKGGFVARHIRGIVSLSLLVLVGVILAMWAYSPGGQRTLALLNLSRQPESYARLAESAARGGSREQEGYYYSRASDLDPENVNYAVLMANAYIASGNTAQATEALKRVIGLQPDNAEAYALLSGLYPVVATRPEEIRTLIDQGYRLTGDSRLSQ